MSTGENIAQWLAAGLVLVLILGRAKKVQARGIRNNNPGNIKKSSAQWLGKVPGDDPVFETFDTPENGIRALARLLLNYERLYGLNTVGGIISRWAPGSENDTGAYVGFVADRLGVAAVDTVIDVRAELPFLVAAIIKYENGTQPYSLATLQAGIDRAVA
jgi:hypothetical protein